MALALSAASSKFFASRAARTSLRADLLDILKQSPHGLVGGCYFLAWEPEEGKTLSVGKPDTAWTAVRQSPLIALKVAPFRLRIADCSSP